jgi:hypothetical protein
MMQGMLMGVNHFTTGLGALLASAIYNVVATATEANGQLLLQFEKLVASFCFQFI